MEDEVLTKAEIDMIKSAFNSMDLNGDGKVSVSELCKACQRINMKLSYGEARKLLQEVDLNGDGYLDFKEFYNMMRDMIEVKKIEEKYLHDIFKTMDKNGDGYITSEELVHSMNLTQDEADDLVREADTDHDGRINFDEFVEGYKGQNDK